eukprot:215936_1
MGPRQSSEEKLLANNSLECALYATQGYRKQMEDAHVMSISLPHHSSYSLFGVFDGFNGDDASTYLAEHITGALDAIKDLDDDDAIIKAIGELDTNYIHSHDADTKQCDSNAGCTFVFAVINTVDINTRLSLQQCASGTPYIYSNSVSSLCSRSFIASTYDSSVCPSMSFVNDLPTSTEDKAFRVRVFWAGDARAVLMSDDRHFRRLTEDHHCNVEHEAERITNAKGTIINDRIDGIVEVSRGFGCRVMKSDASLPFDEQKMISVPDHTTVICGNYNRLLLFCDGLTKKWTDKQFNVRCKHHVMQQKDDKKSEYKAIKYLCKQAMDEGSKDNITALSIRFK